MDKETALALAEQPVVSRHEPTIMELIQQMAVDPRVDLVKLEGLMAMKERIDAREAEMAYSAAMADCQAELGAIVRDAKNESNNSRYARLETIVAKIRPVIARHGFALTFASGVPAVAGNIAIVCKCRHRGGHTETFQLEAGLDTAGPKGGATKTSIQGLGSTVSYLRRYLTLMAFNRVLVNEDNDGQATGFITQQQCDSIFALLSKCGGDTDPKIEAGFLAYMKAKAVGEIHAIDFRKAVEALESKARKLAKDRAEVPEVETLPEAAPLNLGTRRRCKGKLYETHDDGEQVRWREVR